MKVQLAYGQGHLPVELPDDCTTVIEPAHVAGLADERGAVERALDQPIAARPLRQWISPGDRVCILFTDITLLNQLGTHRPNTSEELAQMLTRAVLDNYRVLNHEPENREALVQLGVT